MNEGIKFADNKAMHFNDTAVWVGSVGRLRMPRRFWLQTAACAAVVSTPIAVLAALLVR